MRFGELLRAVGRVVHDGHLAGTETGNDVMHGRNRTPQHGERCRVRRMRVHHRAGLRTCGIDGAVQGKLARRLAGTLEDTAVRERADDDVIDRGVSVRDAGGRDGDLVVAGPNADLPAVRSRMPSRSSSIPTSTILVRVTISVCIRGEPPRLAGIPGRQARAEARSRNGGHQRRTRRASLRSVRPSSPYAG